MKKKIKHGEDAQVYVFDLEHEQKRREQLEKLFNRTKEQVEDESYLIEELKKIEIRKKERERKQQDVNKLLTAVVDLENAKQNNTQQQQQQQQQQQLQLKQKNDNRFSPANSSQQILNQSAPSASLSSGLNKRIKQRKFSTQSNTNQTITSNTSLNNSADLKDIVTSPSSQHQASLSAEVKDRNKKSLIFKVFNLKSLNIVLIIF